MAIVYDKLLSLAIPEVEQTYTAKDTMLYALGVGLGQNPVEQLQLRFVYEENLQALPTMAVVLAHPGPWVRQLDTGIDHVRLVHGEHSLTLHRPVAPSGVVIGRTRVVDAIDKGPGKGALILSERTLYDKASGERLATINQTTFCRADGGFGGRKRTLAQPHVIPSRAPDFVCDLPTGAQAALIYRLSGDYNPLHVDPEFASKAGFARPILHGLATYSVAGHAILKTICGYDPTRLRSISGRFTAPVYPGETFRTSIWRDGDIVSFETRAIGRDVLAIGNGRAEVA